MLNGAKTWITNARRSQLIALLCKTDPTAQPRHTGMSVLLVEKGPGLTVSRDLPKLGYKGVESCELSFDECRVPADALLGGVEGRGFAQMMKGLETGRIQVASRALGVARAALEDSLRYAQDRKSFGKPIWQHQSIGNYLADMATKLTAARQLVAHAADLFDRGERCDMEAGMAKLFASEVAMEIALNAVRIHGGYGYSTEFDVERYFRDAPLMIVGEGTNEIQQRHRRAARQPRVDLVTERVTEGPWFEDYRRGQVFSDAPAMTLSSGRASTHQAIVGDRLWLTLDDELAHAVTGRAPLAHPALVWNVAIGQSTIATHQVKANLFYRGLRFHRLPSIGDTLRTATEVVGLRQNQARPDRASTGLVALRIVTRDQRGDLVLDFVRCAMVPLHAAAELTEHADAMDDVPLPPPVDLDTSVQGWDLDAFRARVGCSSDGLAPGQSWVVSGGDVVSSAPELARLTLNVAQVHHDAAYSGGDRLVYGGHTIGIALAQACRALPNLVTVVGWHGCDHVGPVYEGDTLRSRVEVESVDSLGRPGSLVHLRSRVTADDDGEGRRPVLDWRFIVVAV